MDKRIIITGGSGFLGTRLIGQLESLGVSPSNLRVATSRQTDLRRMDNCLEVTKNVDLVIHLAAKVGGIGFNKAYPAMLFYDNAVMGIQLLEAARANDVAKVVVVGTVCAYPKYSPIPFKEENLWDGYPEETNAPYGLAKKMLLVQCQAYRSQYGSNFIYLILVNLYGPGDNFDPLSSHVIPALIRRMVDAKRANKPSIALWGSGNASREFLYVDDAAQGIIKAAEKYNESDPVNLGTGEEITIKALAGAISKLTGYRGSITWDLSKPDGQPRRSLDVSKAKKYFGFKAKTPLTKGLEETIKWFVHNYPQ